MNQRWRHSVVIALVVVACVGSLANGGPSVEITGPDDGATVLTHSVNVTGVANGSDDKWFQGTAADFEAGTKDAVAVDSTGGLRLAMRVEDYFDDNSIDATKWTVTNQGGISAVEEAKVLHIKGTSTSNNYWEAMARIDSTSAVSTYVQATLTSFAGSGGGYSTCLFLMQDSSNYIGIGEQHDQSWGSGTYVALSVCIGGSGSVSRSMSVVSHPHIYRITNVGGVARLYQDDVELLNRTISMTSPKVVLFASALLRGDTVDAKWDNVRSEYNTVGTLVSSVGDTRSVNPILRAIGWNSSAPPSTQVYLEARTCPTSDMSTASVWIPIANGQTSGLPPDDRYLQYRVRLTTTNQSAIPMLWNVTFAYSKPIVRVELSADEGATWAQAEGLARWWCVLDLPEGTSYLRARVTDVAGDANESKVRVEVDTTPPEGSVLIGGGAPSTAIRAVNLTLDAVDRYGVSLMKVGDREDLADAIWRPYVDQLGWVLPPGDGMKTVYARFKDTNGLESATVNGTILLDTMAPVGTVTINGGAAYTNSKVLDLAMCATDVSGVSDVMVSERADFVGAGWLPFSGSLNFTLGSMDGERTVHVVFRDPLGHVSAVASASIYLDTVAPVVGLTIGDGAAYTPSRDVQLKLEVSEPTRIAHIQVGDDPALIGAPNMTYSPEVSWNLRPGDGAKEVYARAWDLAGNGGPIASASILLDTIPPSVTVSIGGGAAYTSEPMITVTIAAVDASPIVAMQLGEDPGLSGAVPESFKDRASLALSAGDGLKTVYARVTDAAGNAGPIARASIALDTTPPSLTLSLEHGAAYTTSRDVNVSLASTDVTGTASMELGEDPALLGATGASFVNLTSWTLSPGDGGKVLYGRATDLAGNRGPIVSSLTIMLDTTPPESAMDPLKAVSGSEEIAISWKGIDVTSGIAAFDVQWREGSGAWTDLLVGTNATHMTFKGQDGRIYSFRVRARDAAGNQEPYPEVVTDSVQIDVPEPISVLPSGSVIGVAIVVIAAVCVGAVYAFSRKRQGEVGPSGRHD